MDDIQRQYQKRKRIYFGLLVVFFATLAILYNVFPHAEHKASPVELFLLACLAGCVIGMYWVFRCPKCNMALVPAYSSSWARLRYCPKCGATLVEK